MRVAVFTGSSFGASPAYARAAEELGAGLAGAGAGIVYGGGNVGLMGTVADAALRAGGEVLGVIPQALVDRELAHPGLTELRTVRTMHERKAAMADAADAFVALPGGAGTLEELFEAWTWQHLGYHAKPVMLYDVDGFWQPLLDMVARMVEAGFIKERFRETLPVVRTPAEALEAAKTWQPPSGKWDGER